MNSAPAHGPFGPESPYRTALERLFGRYNPLFFASAGLVLLGAWQLSVGLEEAGFGVRRTIPLAVLEIYQFSLVFSVIFLARRLRQRRPVVILALLGALFLLDPTLELTRIVLQTTQSVGVSVSFLWVLLVPVLAASLARALDLVPTAETTLGPLWAAVGIAAGPNLLDSSSLGTEPTFLWLTAWGLGLVVWMIRRPVPLEPRSGKLEGWAQTVRDRSARALAVIWLLAFGLHWISWAFVFDVFPWLAVSILCCLAAVASVRIEKGVWIGAAGSLVLGLEAPEALPAISLALAFLLGIRCWEGLPRRLLVGAVACGWIAAIFRGWSGGEPPSSPLVWSILAAAALIALALRFRWPSALWMALPIALVTQWPEPALGSLGRGVVLVAVGFLALGLGVAVASWASTASDPREPRQEPS